MACEVFARIHFIQETRTNSAFPVLRTPIHVHRTENEVIRDCSNARRISVLQRMSRMKVNTNALNHGVSPYCRGTHVAQLSCGTTTVGGARVPTGTIFLKPAATDT